MFDDRVLICFVGIILSALTQYFDIVSPGPGPVKGSHTSDTGVTTLVLVRGSGEGFPADRSVGGESSYIL